MKLGAYEVPDELDIYILPQSGGLWPDEKLKQIFSSAVENHKYFMVHKKPVGRYGAFNPDGGDLGRGVEMVYEKIEEPIFSGF